MIDWIKMFAHAGVQGFVIELMRYMFAAGGLTILIWAGRRWTERRRIQSRRADFADRRREITHSLETMAVFTFSTVVTLALSKAGIIRLSMDLPPLWLGAIEIIGIVIAHDAYFYWMHRGLHLKALFRRTHLLHHKSRTPTPFAAYSFAPLEAVTESMFLPLFLLAVPFHAPLVFAFLLHQIIRNVQGHAGHEFAWPGFTRSRWTGWLTTTTHHDLHHSEGRYNFGLYFTWWDRMMGTEHPHYHQRFEQIVAKRAAPVTLGGGDLSRAG